MEALEKIIGKPFRCTCGRLHEVPIRSLSLDADMEAVAEACLMDFRGSHVLIVSDRTTHGLYGRELAGLLGRRGFTADSCLYTEAKALPDERSLGKLLMSSAGKPGGLVAVGSGTITDLTRLAAALRHGHCHGRRFAACFRGRASAGPLSGERVSPRGQRTARPRHRGCGGNLMCGPLL
ncbi:iron-containing alcohol dehydrogenase [Paenibacillus sp. S150]|nr:iron-containing alcohol dehydrogenase [Paenibacillus sp. S150]